MTTSSTLSLLAAMFTLALVPSVSVLAVSARAASAGFTHGVATTLGIILGDIAYILLAIFGLALLTEALGGATFLIQYVAGIYMIWIGTRLWKSAGRHAVDDQGESSSSLFSSFLTGLLITLADQKVVLFYLGFLPAFIDLVDISRGDTAIIIVITVIAVGAAKLIYVVLAQKAGALMGSGASGFFTRVASVVMLSVGGYLLLKP